MPSQLPKTVRHALEKVPRVTPGTGRDVPPLSEADDLATFGLNTRPGHEDDGWRSPLPAYLRDGTRLQLFKDGEAAAAAYRAIEDAEHRVLLEVYIWPGDETGEAFSHLLAEKAAAGVRVFVIYDAFGCLLTPAETFDRMRRSGANVLEFHPLNPWRSRWGWRPANRDHRKLLVVDDNVAGVGGLNIGNDYAGNWVAPNARVRPGDMYRDAGVGIVGPAAEAYARAFQKTWRYVIHRGPMSRASVADGIRDLRPAKGARIGKSRESIDARQGVLQPGRDIGLVGSAPTLSSPLRPFLHDLINESRHSLLLTIAYFAPDDALIDSLCRAARRGVRVRLMLAGRSDVRFLISAGRAFYGRLLDAGCEIYERQEAFLHQKSIISDGRVTVLGSTNLDYRSIEFNLELSAVIDNRPFARQMIDLFDHDTGFARRIDPETWRRRPTRDRFVQWLISRLRYAL